MDRGNTRKTKDIGRHSRLQLLLAATGIVKPLTEYGLDIQIQKEQVFLELFPTGDQISVLVEDETVAIEDKLILPPDQIVVSYDDRVARSRCREHALPPVALARMI